MATLGDYDRTGEEKEYLDSATRLKALQQTTTNVTKAIPGLGAELLRNYMSSAAEQYKDVVGAEVEKAGRDIYAKPKLTIKASLSPRHSAQLLKVCEAYDVNFASVDSHDHCAARAATTVHEAFIMDREFDVKHWTVNTKLKHIGENPIREIMKGSAKHNCLCYTGAGDPRDMARHSEALARITTTDWSGYGEQAIKAARNYCAALKGKTGNAQCCGKLFQDCDDRADFAYARNVHDISPREVALGMAKSGVKKTCGVLMYAQSLFYPEIEHVCLPFTKYAVRINRREDKIVFRGPNDSQDMYVHSWCKYSRWFTGDRVVTVKHGGVMKSYMYTFKLCALDHITWCMTPVFGTAATAIERVLPFGEDDTEVAVYGCQFSNDRDSLGLMKKPRKRDMMVPRVVYIPKTVYFNAACYLNLQKKEFTVDAAKKVLTQTLRRELGNNDAAISVSDINFVATQIYQSLYDDNYLNTQAVAEGLKAQAKHRARFDASLPRRAYRTFRHWMNQPSDKDRVKGAITRYSLENGQEGRIVLPKRETANSFVNKLGLPALNDMPMRPLVFSRQTALIFKETPVSLLAELAATIAQTRDELLESIDRAAQSECRYKNRYSPYEKEPAYTVMEAEKTHANSCVIDAFTSAYTDVSNRDCTYYEVAMRISQAQNLRYLPQCADILTSLEKKQMMPLEVYHILAEEYNARIYLYTSGRVYEYGVVSDVTIHLRYEDGHVTPIRLSTKNFPACNADYAEETRDPRDAFVLAAEVVGNDAARDAAIKLAMAAHTEGGRRNYEAFGHLDLLFSTRERKTVLDPEARFCDNVHALRHLNWQWHSLVGSNPGVERLLGIGRPYAESDPVFWDCAINDASFAFDGILMDCYREEDRHMLAAVIYGNFRHFNKMLRPGGRIMVTMHVDDKKMFEELLAQANEMGMGMSINRAREVSMLTTVCSVILHADGTRATAGTYETYCAERRRMISYFSTVATQSASMIDQVVEIRQHLAFVYPYEGYHSYVEAKDQTRVDVVKQPSRDIFVIENSKNDDAARVVEALFVPETCVKKQARRFVKARAKINSCKAYVKERFGSRDTPLQNHDAIYDTPGDAFNVESGGVKKEDIKDEIIVSDNAPLATQEEELDQDIAEEDMTSYTEGGSDEMINIDNIATTSIDVVDDVDVDKTECPSIVDAEEKRCDDDKEVETDTIPWDKSTFSKHELGNIQYEAIREFVEYNRTIMEKLPRVCESYYLSIQLSEGKVGTFQAGEKDFLYINKKGKVSKGLTSSISDDYTGVYDVVHKKVVPRVEFEEECVGHEGIVTRDMDPYLCEKIVRRFGNYKEIQVKPLIIEVNQAVSGAGKTHEIIMSMDVKNDLIIESTRNGRLDATQKLVKLRGEEMKAQEIEDTRVKTCYSQLLNPVDARVLWVDEMTLHHQGAIFLCAILAGAHTIKCYGDCGQNYVFSGIDSFVFKKHKIDETVKPLRYLTMTRRLSKAVTLLAKRFYRRVEVMANKELTTTSDVAGSIVLAPFSINNVICALDRAVQNNMSAVVLSFTRADRQLIEREIAKRGHLSHIMSRTIVQYQGSEADIVILIRTSTHSKSKGMYADNARLLTAVTRAKREFHYLSNAQADELSLNMKALSAERCLTIHSSR